MKKIIIKIFLFMLVFSFLIYGCKRLPTSANAANSSDIYEIDQNSCIACGQCYDVCPHNAIIYQNEKPVIVQSKCKRCGECVSVCPVDAIH
jgi:MinD superfamily P-loop ATPase